jgi:formylglycine-generating enzyme required for sulfatase activity
MLIQRAGTPGGTLPPRGFAPPAWMNGSRSVATALIPCASKASRRSPPKDLLLLNEQVFTIGHDDFEAEDSDTSLLGSAMTAEKYEFGWDNEHPRRQVSIDRPVLVEKLCITNAEYLSYFRASGKKSQNPEVPASWVIAEDSGVEFKVCSDKLYSIVGSLSAIRIQVRTLYGPVSFAVAGDWPFAGSFDEIASFAEWKGGRVLNEAELRAFIDQYLGAENTPVGFKEWSFVPYVHLLFL